MPTKNLHWLIKAHLAKRGGRKSHVRIAPEAVPGYIAALRETNKMGDGRNGRNGPMLRKPKQVIPTLNKTDGEPTVSQPRLPTRPLAPFPWISSTLVSRLWNMNLIHW